MPAASGRPNRPGVQVHSHRDRRPAVVLQGGPTGHVAPDRDCQHPAKAHATARAIDPTSRAPQRPWRRVLGAHPTVNGWLRFRLGRGTGVITDDRHQQGARYRHSQSREVSPGTRTSSALIAHPRSRCRSATVSVGWCSGSARSWWTPRAPHAGRAERQPASGPETQVAAARAVATVAGRWGRPAPA